MFGRLKTDIRLHNNNNNKFLASQKTRSVTIRKSNRLMLYREIIGNECDLHVEHNNAQCEQNVYLLMLVQLVRIVTISRQLR